MKRTLALIFAILCALMLVLAFCPVLAHAETRSEAHKTTHTIVMTTRVEDGGRCSATAIGPQTLLTASHCEMPTDKVEIDEHDAKIVKILRDENDHSIFLITGVRFDHWAHVKMDAKFEMGDRIYLFGNPDGMTDVYREGYMATTKDFGKWIDTYWDFNGFFGDSGSGMFDNDGQVVAVLSQMRKEFKLMVTLPLAFTTDQMKEATDYCRHCDPPPPPKKNDVADIIKVLMEKK